MSVKMNQWEKQVCEYLRKRGYGVEVGVDEIAEHLLGASTPKQRAWVNQLMRKLALKTLAVSVWDTVSRSSQMGRGHKAAWKIEAKADAKG